MEQKKIGRFFSELRKEQGITQEQLAEKLGVTNRTISRWENGVNMPDFDVLIEMANFYDVSIEELLDGERKEERKTEMIEKETENTLLKVADYENQEKIIFSKRMGHVFKITLAAFVIYCILEWKGLTSTGIYEDIASFALGLVLGVLVLGTILTSRYGAKVQAFKKRLLKRND